MALERVLIANRGAIAVRIIRTLRRMGIGSVAVYSDADSEAPHVRMADAAVRIGGAHARESYLRADRIVAAALETGADAVHPGYGFLSEDAAFCEAVEGAGLAFCGPTADHLRAFGDKRRAREIAEGAGLMLLPGSGRVTSAEEALAAAGRIGYPVMLKSAHGGGGIGMTRCDGPEEVRDGYESAARVSEASFGRADLIVERFVGTARHVEVQVFGDGAGGVTVLGERDCSAQRRNQKVIEEAPAPGLRPDTRAALHEAARTIAAAVRYRSAGTVEFLLDAEFQGFYFLEVNARLQVEHGVTEEVFGVDLVEWMVRLAGGEPVPALAGPPRGHAIQARLYAEDPARDFTPSSGVVTGLALPGDARVETWVARGTEVSPHYDPMLAKIIVHAPTRGEAVARLGAALGATRVEGIATNLDLLRTIAASRALAEGRLMTRSIAAMQVPAHGIAVTEAAGHATVQELPGRLGLWAVGIPPSGPMDERSFRLGNRAVGNPETAAGLEITIAGPELRLDEDAVLCLTGAPMEAALDGAPVPMWEPVRAAAGATLRIGGLTGGGRRAYLLVRGGIDTPPYLGSRATFTLGGFGGHAGRPLRPGDVLTIGGLAAGEPAPVPPGERPVIGRDWVIEVLDGPLGAPDFMTPAGIARLYAAEWRVHHNSDRTGVRLIGPRPEWARPDGGDAGLHPSNVHDNAYAIGTVDFTGDMPVVLGPDGPSLGGFVCPFTLARDELWKLGQLAAGDTVRFRARDRAAPVLRRGSTGGVDMVVRRQGDENVLVEFGPPALDLEMRLRADALMRWLRDEAPAGIVDLTPGIRSLQVHVDPDRLPVRRLLDLLARAEGELPGVDDLEVESREIRLPLSWDDPEARAAVARYGRSVRDDAPWYPSNIEFIRRINGLADEEAVRDIVHAAEYLVLGLGDVYLGAPVATPVDPRHRLVTTKYNPARTWTPENAVGIGGAYMCIYGMEGPGGYQLVGRTVPVWSTYGDSTRFSPDTPWLLRFFDRIRFFPVSHEELADWRAGVRSGRIEPEVVPGRLSLREHRRFLDGIAPEAAAFRARQQEAFAAERARWEASGELDAAARAATRAERPAGAGGFEVPEGALVVGAPLGASVVAVSVEEGDVVRDGDTLVVLEAMKMEMSVAAPAAGTIERIGVAPGDLVDAGQGLVALRPGGAR